MSRSGQITVKILGDSSHLDHALGQVQGRLSGFGSKMTSVGSLVAGAFAGAGLVAGIKSVLSAAAESNRVAAQTTTVLKSTGGAAQVTARQVSDLANAIAAKSGIDDEAIQSGENLLLTFTNIRNEVGKGNDIFNQATQLTTDMSVALGQDMKTSAIQLGKALNDPVKGITALQRVGVSFTKSQRDQIKALVASGHTMTAQKVILAELRKEFGGSAAAVATPWDKLKVSLGNVEESLGNVLIPMLSKATTWVADKLPKGIDFLRRLFHDIIATWNDPDVTSSGFFGTVERTVSRARELFDEFRPKLEAVGAFIEAHWKPILIGAGVALGLAFAPITTVVVGLVLLYAKCQAVRDAVREVAEFFRTQLIPAFKATVDWINTNLVPTFKTAFEAVRAIVETYVAIIRDLWERFGSHLVDHIVTAFNAIKQTVQGVLEVIRGIFDVFAGIFTGDWSRVWKGIQEIFGGVFNALSGIVKYALNAVSTVIGAGMAVISAAWSAVWGGLSDVVSGVWETIKHAGIVAINFLTQHVINPLIDAIGAAIGAYNRIADLPLNPAPHINAPSTIAPIREPADPLKTGPSRPDSDRNAPGAPGASAAAAHLNGVTLHVYNPTSEPTEQSVTRELQRASYLLGVA